VDAATAAPSRPRQRPVDAPARRYDRGAVEAHARPVASKQSDPRPDFAEGGPVREERAFGGRLYAPGAALQRASP